MSKLDTNPYKGVRDFYPEDKFIQNYIFGKWKMMAEKFGYEEYDASVLEHTEIYKEKSGEEIINEQTYTFTDRGGRDVTLRPEMTPTVARMVAAKRRELGFPLRWYSIPNIFRYEATQRGRLREHWQLNVDIFGVNSLHADIETIILADRIMKAFGATNKDYEIRLNVHNAPEEQLNTVYDALKKSNMPNVRIDKDVQRGQAYYKGVVFEFYDTNSENSRSILGGGRYDNLTSLFEDFEMPAVGFGAGDVTLRDFLETHGLLPTYVPATKVYIVQPDSRYVREVVEIAKNLRMKGVNTAIDWTERKVGDQIKAADKLKIPFVMVIGENELKEQKFSIKNLSTGEEKEINLEDIPNLVNS